MMNEICSKSMCEEVACACVCVRVVCVCVTMRLTMIVWNYVLDLVAERHWILRFVIALLVVVVSGFWLPKQDCDDICVGTVCVSLVLLSSLCLLVLVGLCCHVGCSTYVFSVLFIIATCGSSINL